jgi:adenosine deaminase
LVIGFARRKLLKNRTLLFVFLLCSSFVYQAGAQAGGSAEQRTAAHFRSIRNRPLMLRAFLQQMPKGGDLHNHLTGAVYAETYIQTAAKEGLCVDRQALAFTAAPCTEGQPPAARALQDPVLYRQLIDAFSMRGLHPATGSGHDHFFDTFGKFRLAARARPAEMIAEVASRAAAQNESYLELFLNPDHAASAQLGAKLGWNDDLAVMRDKLLTGGLREIVTSAANSLDRIDADAHKILCATQESAACKTEVRYIYEVYREFPKEQFFALALAGFEIASADPRVVAVNPVMPEDGYVSMRDYELHMRIFEFLHKNYPNVHISLHAGELAPGLVPPEGLRSHIRQAVEIAHAERIGHGVDVLYEDQPVELLKEMARKKVVVEICLSSNDQILGVKGDQHPLPEYLRAGVPVVIATDDEGVARSSLTGEYQRAVTGYNLSYPQLKQIVRNSLTYSFADRNTRAKLLKDLEERFRKFEKQF